MNRCCYAYYRLLANENHAKSGKLLGILRGGEDGCFHDLYFDKGSRSQKNLRLVAA